MQLHRVCTRQAAARVSAGAAHPGREAASPGGEPAALNPHLPGGLWQSSSRMCL